MGQNQSTFQNKLFVINCYRNCQESEVRETKKYDLGTFFYIVNFLKLVEIEADFSINLNKCFLKSISTFGVKLLSY